MIFGVSAFRQGMDGLFICRNSGFGGSPPSNQNPPKFPGFAAVITPSGRLLTRIVDTIFPSRCFAKLHPPNSTGLSLLAPLLDHIFFFLSTFRRTPRWNSAAWRGLIKDQKFSRNSFHTGSSKKFRYRWLAVKTDQVHVSVPSVNTNLNLGLLQ